MTNPRFLYLIEWPAGGGYDTYDSAVVVAESKKQAKAIHPTQGLDWDGTSEYYHVWGSSKEIKATKIGYCALAYKPGTVICASFNAG